MDFSYSDEQQMLQESVQKFVHKSYSFDARKKIMASSSGYSEENWRLFAELGWLTVPFSEADGGFGGRSVDLMVMMEEFGKALLVEPFLPTAILGGGVLSELGSAQQKETLLTAVMDGSLQLALAYAEAGSRFNLANVTTTATKKGDELIIDGTKIFVLNGQSANYLLVTAREAGAATDANGISVILVDSKAAGISMVPYPTVDGRQAAQIQFKSVSVPVASRLGVAGKAHAALSQVIDRATVAVCAEATGALEALLRKTVEYSKTRKQFDVPIGSFQALQHRMADMFIECQLARSIVLRAAMMLDSQGGPVEKAKAVSAAKSRVGKAIFKVGQEAIQIHGGIGMTDELDVAHLFKRVTANSLLFGDSDFHTSRFATL